MLKKCLGVCLGDDDTWPDKGEVAVELNERGAGEENVWQMVKTGLMEAERGRNNPDGSENRAL